MLVLDLSLPKRSGLGVLEDVLRDHPRVRVVILSMYPEDAVALHALDQGAMAYVHKARPSEELLRAIRRAARGQTYVSEALEDLRVEGGPDRPADLPHHALTAREYQVFMLLLEGLQVREVAVELACSPSTAANHVHAIKTKLGAHTLTDIVRYGSRVGLV